MGIRFFNSDSRHSTLTILIIIAVAAAAGGVRNANAGRLELRNELKGLQGRDRVLTARCWSSHDRLGIHSIMPGQYKSWSFKTVNLWPLAFTEFRCELGTAFGLTRDRDIVVFKASTWFLWECDQPNKEECIWVAKNDGLYLRTKSTSSGLPQFRDVLKTTWGRKTYLSSLFN